MVSLAGLQGGLSGGGYVSALIAGCVRERAIKVVL